MKLAVVIANLGGPDSLEAVRPFLFNLFNDRAIIGLPQPFRFVLAKLLSSRRAPIAAGAYTRMGGASPILKETEAQRKALQQRLQERADINEDIRVFIAMRYWHPLIVEAAREVKAWGADRVVLLPLYPQFSTTTTRSFFEAWDDAVESIQLSIPQSRICCYATEGFFSEAYAALIQGEIAKLPHGQAYRLLFSAHGLPKRVVERGDPYQWQIEQSAQAIVKALGEPELDWRICYQSRVGPLAWLEPSTEREIIHAGAERKALIVVPIAFVSEHAETLIELDHDYALLAAEAGVGLYLRVPALGLSPAYMQGLADLALRVSRRAGLHAAAGRRICPASCRACPHSPNAEA